MSATVKKLRGTSVTKSLKSPTTGSPSSFKARSVLPTVKVSLPTKNNVPPSTLSDYSICLFGEKGIGKTSVAAKFTNPLTFLWEPGRRNLKIRQIPDTSKSEEPLTWPRFKAYLKLLTEGKTLFKTIITDTIDRAYESCLEQVCLSKGMKHPGEANDFGFTWSLVKREFESTMNSLLENGMTPIFISHARVQTFQARTGTPFDLVVPTCQGVAWNYMKATCDLAIYYGYHGTERSFSIGGSERLWAACGLEGHFLDPDGNPLVEFSAGNSATEAYKILCDAFNNKIYSYEAQEERPDVPVMLSRAKKRKKPA